MLLNRTSSKQDRTESPYEASTTCVASPQGSAPPPPYCLGPPVCSPTPLLSPFPAHMCQKQWQVLFWHYTFNTHIYWMLLLRRPCAKCLHIGPNFTDHKWQREGETLWFCSCAPNLRLSFLHPGLPTTVRATLCFEFPKTVSRSLWLNFLVT